MVKIDKNICSEYVNLPSSTGLNSTFAFEFRYWLLSEAGDIRWQLFATNLHPQLYSCYTERWSITSHL